jgi:hypothetical protein
MVSGAFFALRLSRVITSVKRARSPLSSGRA